MIVIAVLSCIGIEAALRTPDEALRIAAGVFGQVEKHYAPGKSPVSNKSPQIADSTLAYYAVNTEEGFVLVGADDRLPEVLGYSDGGVFDNDSIPPAFRFWLQCYEEELEISTLRQQSTGETGTAPKRFDNAKGFTAVTPLVTSKWNQSAPYNNYAPAYNETGAKSVTGCVATAMAQIMYFHRHPQQGTGKHSYNWVSTNPTGMTATLSADFGKTTYHWDKMLDSYKSGYTDAQADAVASLMYHCGVSVEMGYGISSGAYTDRVPAALCNYFGYDANYQRIQKVLYPADSLSAIVRKELEEKRPVLVSGSNNEGGHAFVCDGCDARGYFHINWGWAGASDGYYLLTALNPGAQGIGGTSKGYNQSTSFFIGLKPAGQAPPKAVPQMGIENFTVSNDAFNRSATFSVSLTKLQNFGLTDFSGNYGIALYDEDETQLVAVLSQASYSLKAGFYRTTTATLSNISIPASIPAATYHLCAVYKNADYGWMRLLCTQDDYFRTVELTSSRVIFYPNDAAAVLSLTKPIAFPEGTNADSIPFIGLPLSFAVQNTGGTFRGQISARIYKGAFSKGQYELIEEAVIRRNTVFVSALQQAFDANLLLDTQYKMKLCWRADANDAWHDFEPAEYGVLNFKLVEQSNTDDPDTPTALQPITDKNNMNNGKYLQNGQLVIYYNGKMYNAQGILMQ